MAPKRRRDPWFCLPVVVCMLIDAGISLAMQPASYWSDPSTVHEGNPTWELLLSSGPAWFLVGFAGYCLIIASALVWLRGALQKLLGMFVLLAHSYGAAGWCHLELSEGAYWWGLIAVFLLGAVVFSVYWRLSPLCDRQCAVTDS